MPTPLIYKTNRKLEHTGISEDQPINEPTRGKRLHDKTERDNTFNYRGIIGGAST